MTDLVRQPLEAPVLARLVAILVGRSIFPLMWLKFEPFDRPRACEAGNLSEKVSQAWNRTAENCNRDLDCGPQSWFGEIVYRYRVLACY